MQPLLHSPDRCPVMCLCRCHFVGYCVLFKHYLLTVTWHDRTKRQSTRPHSTTQRSSAYLRIDTVIESQCACSLHYNTVSWCVVVVIVFSCDRGIDTFTTSLSCCSHRTHTSWWIENKNSISGTNTVRLIVTLVPLYYVLIGSVIKSVFVWAFTCTSTSTSRCIFEYILSNIGFLCIRIIQ